MYRRADRGWTKHFDFILLDLLCLELSFVLAVVIRQAEEGWNGGGVYKGMAFALAVIQIMVSVFFDTFKNVLKRGYYREFTAAVKNILLVLLISAAYLFLARQGEMYSRRVWINTGLLYLVTSYGVRLLWKRFLRKVRHSKRGTRSLLLVTNRERLPALAERIRENNYEGFRIAGAALLDVDACGTEESGIPVVADRETVRAYTCREWIDEVFLDIPGNTGDFPYLAEQFVSMGITVHIILAGMEELDGRKQFTEKLSSYNVLTYSINTASTRELFLKRVMDICGGLTGCLLTLVILIFVGPAIYLKSPGPIFFSQVRVGRNGHRFKMYKFRSMYMDADERKRELMEANRIGDGLMFKLDNDPRIIGSEKGPGKGIGNLIRKTSLDEFPQFWNVLKGDMSLVGTRPPTVDEWEKYQLHHRARLAIKPGMTGMWQVSGRSDITDFEEVVRLDTEYIEKWRIGMDIRLLVKTVVVVLRGRGSM